MTEETTAVSAGQHSGVLASLGLQPQLFVFQLINFVIISAILWFLILKPLVKKLEERKHIIDEGLDSAKRAQSELGMAEVRARDIIDDAKVEANKAIERGVSEAAMANEQMRKKVRADLDLLMNQAKRNIEIDKQDMRAEIRKETATLVVTAVEKILKEKFDGKKDEAFIQETLGNLR